MTSISRVVHVAEMARLITDEMTFADGYAAVRDDGSPDDPRWLQEWLREALLDDRIRITNERELNLTTMIEILDDYAVRLFCFPWSLLRSSDGVFATSDSGVGVIDHGRADADQISVLGSDSARLLMPLARDNCLQVGPAGQPTFTVSEEGLTGPETTTVNLAMYGWATRYVFADRQHTAAKVRVAAKRRPKEVMRPRPYTQYVLIEREPGDDSLAVSHRRVGRAPYVEHDDTRHDYVVLRDDKELPRAALRAVAISKARAERRYGTKSLRSGNDVLSPLEIRRHRRRSAG